MKWFASLFLALSLAFLPGCATDPATGRPVVVAPKSPVQSIYALEVSLTAAINAFADVHDKGIVVGANYEKGKAISKQASATLLDAKKAATAKDATRTPVYLTTLAALIDDLAKLNGGVK